MASTRIIRRRSLLGAAAALGAASLLPMRAGAQAAFPNKPIRLIVPFTPGGVTDTSGRVIADYLGKRLGWERLRCCRCAHARKQPFPTSRFA